MIPRRPRKAPHAGALLVCALLGAFAWSLNAASDSRPRCAATAYHQTGVVRQVFDGDTLELADGRRVRLLGIDTPELGHDDRPPEPYAEPARTFLESLAPQGTRVRLRFDRERQDRYRRRLAHVFLADGTNLQAELVAAGLATTLVVPPNQWNHDCYATLEASARVDGLGIWSLERYRSVPAERISQKARGFRIVTGRVQRIGEGRRNLWLNLAPGVAVRIPKEDLVHFPGGFPRGLLGREVEVRGHVERRRGELRLMARHPAAIRLLE